MFDQSVLQLSMNGGKASKAAGIDMLTGLVGYSADSEVPPIHTHEVKGFCYYVFLYLAYGCTS